MRKALRAVTMAAAVLMVGGLAVAAVAANGGPSAGTPSTPSTSLTPSPSPSVDDVKGTCDEQEHVNDPECRGPQEPEDRAAEGPNGSAVTPDNSGPSDDSGPSSVDVDSDDHGDHDSDHDDDHGDNHGDDHDDDHRHDDRDDDDRDDDDRDDDLS